MLLFRDDAWTISHINITQLPPLSKEKHLILSAAVIRKIQNAKC